MINGQDLYNVLSAVVPLYVAMMVAYGSVKWWKILTPEQCGGINRFVSVFAVPLLSFKVISTNNLYEMDFRFIAADTISKVALLTLFGLWAKFTKRGSFDWMITIFMLATLPNTLVMGIPLIKAMYGDAAEALVVQAVVMQGAVWYTLLLFLYEYRAAKTLIMKQFPETMASIVSIKVDSDVMSLDGKDAVQAEAVYIRDDGKIHVEVRKSVSSSRGFRLDHLHSSRRLSGLTSMPSSKAVTPRPSNLTEAEIYSLHSINLTSTDSSFSQTDWSDRDPKEVHLLVRNQTDSNSNGVIDRAGPEVRRQNYDQVRDDFPFGNSKGPAKDKFPAKDGPSVSRERGSSSITELTPKLLDSYKEAKMPPSGVMFRLILVMVLRKLVRNPNTYSSLLGIIWSLVSYRWNIGMPTIIGNSISILSDAGLGMAMFSLGLFMALQGRLIVCGPLVAIFAMAVRFITGPAAMAAASVVVGMKGTLLRAAIVQAALPQGIVPFVFSKDYNLHPDVLSTGVIFGMVISLPITILYSVILGL